MKIGGQEHFYLEPNSTLAIPGEVRALLAHLVCLSKTPTSRTIVPYTNFSPPNTKQDGALEVWASTQNPTKTQNFCAYVCGVPANKARLLCVCWLVCLSVCMDVCAADALVEEVVPFACAYDLSRSAWMCCPTKLVKTDIGRNAPQFKPNLPPTPSPAHHHQVVCRMKRMGGGFGGKETRSVFISCTAALAAHLTGRPVRVTLDRDVDMLITGQRHAFVAK